MRLAGLLPLVRAELCIACLRADDSMPVRKPTFLLAQIVAAVALEPAEMSRSWFSCHAPARLHPEQWDLRI